MIKAVLFDLDGTLVNSLGDLCDATNTALVKNGFPARKIEEFNYFVGDGIPAMLRRALPDGADDEDTLMRMKESFFEYYSQHYADKTTCYDGMQKTITALKTQGIAVAVLSNKAQNMAESVTKKLYGEDFNIIQGMCDRFPAKPDPQSALSVMERLSVSPQECAIVGDSGMDVATAVNCGAMPVGVLWGFRAKEELLENGAVYLLSKPTELLDLIKENNS